MILSPATRRTREPARPWPNNHKNKQKSRSRQSKKPANFQKQLDEREPTKYSQATRRNLDGISAEEISNEGPHDVIKPSSLTARNQNTINQLSGTKGRSRTPRTTRKRGTEPQQVPQGVSKPPLATTQPKSDKTVIFTGHQYQSKEDHLLRFVFLNYNGIPLTKIGLADFVQSSKEIRADFLGIAESHLDSRKNHVKHSVLSALQSPLGYSNVNGVFAQSDVDYSSDKKHGGVFQFAAHKLATRVTSCFSDPYGRYTSQTFIGRNNCYLTVITAYRVVEGNAGPFSAYAQQRAMLVTAGRIADPRKALIQDLSEYIQKMQTQGHSILLGIDANEPTSAAKSGIQSLVALCGLLDVHATLFPNQKWASHRRGSVPIDFFFASVDLMPHINRAGILPLDEVFDSDHRPLFIDLDGTNFFRGISVDKTNNRTRSFTTKNAKHTKIIRTVISQEWTTRNLTKRIEIIDKISRKPKTEIRLNRLAEMWEKIDQEIGRVFQEAEKSLHIPAKKMHKWSPALAKSGAVKRYWRTRLAKAEAGHHGSILTRQAATLSLNDDGTTDLNILRQRYDSATRHYAAMINRDVQLREDHLSTLQAQLSVKPDPEIQQELKAIQQIQRTEKMQQLFRHIRSTLKPMRRGIISQVEIPPDLSHALETQPDLKSPVTTSKDEVRNILQRIIRHKRTATEEWTTVINQKTLETSILLFCSQHFQQASSTPFGSGQLFRLLGASGQTPTGESMLSGSWLQSHPEINSRVLRAFIAHLAIPEPLRTTPALDTEISDEEYQSAIQKWSERTTTSPSGRHLGFYKTLKLLPSIQKDMCTMLNIVIRTGLVPTRWTQAVSVLLEKDPGRPSLNRLRIIHLFEADYNLFLKLLWAKRLIARGEEHNQFGEAQQGSRKGRTATNAVILKRLTYDLTRIQRSNLGTFDNDAKSCYDRIVNSLAMLVSKRLGMPDEAIRTHAGVLSSMRYTVKTTFGISELYIQSTPGSFLFGTGQGSGASPAIWLMLSAVLLKTLKDLSPRGMFYMSPDGIQMVHRCSDAFVDDTQNGLTDAHLRQSWSFEQIFKNLTEMAQTWEQLLHCSRGALELNKCSYYILYWTWKKGLPSLTTIAESPSEQELKLSSGNSTATQVITRRDINEPTKTLGVWMCPNGDESAQVTHLRIEANKFASLLRSSRLSKVAAYTAYRTSWIPAVTYSLNTTTMTQREMMQIQLQATAASLQKIGVNKNFPRAVVFGPTSMGGLEFRDLYVEQGAGRILLLLSHLYHNSEVGKMLFKLL